MICIIRFIFRHSKNLLPLQIDADQLRRLEKENGQCRKYGECDRVTVVAIHRQLVRSHSGVRALSIGAQQLLGAIRRIRNEFSISLVRGRASREGAARVPELDAVEESIGIRIPPAERFRPLEIRCFEIFPELILIGFAWTPRYDVVTEMCMPRDVIAIGNFKHVGRPRARQRPQTAEDRAHHNS